MASADTGNYQARERKPSALEMIKQAIESLRVTGPGSRKGVSVQAIKRFIEFNYMVDMDTYGKLVNRALKKGIASGDVIQTQGLTGAVGSFRLPPTKPSRPKDTNSTQKKEKAAKKEKPTKKEPSKLPAKPRDLRKKVIPATAPKKKDAQ